MIADPDKLRDVEAARQLKGPVKPLRNARDDLAGITCSERFADCIAWLAEINGATQVMFPIGSEPRQVGEWQSARMDMKAAQLGTAVQLREHLTGVQQSVRIERAL